MKYLTIIALAALTGCAALNPNAGQTTVTTNPATGVTTTNVAPAYIPNPTVTAIVGYGNTAAPFIPAPWGTILSGVLAAATIVSTTIATKKSNAAATSSATADQLAASVVAQGPTVAQAVLAHASNNSPVYPAVAAAINNNTV